MPEEQVDHLTFFCLEVAVVSGQSKKLWPEASTFYGKAQRKVWSYQLQIYYISFNNGEIVA